MLKRMRLPDDVIVQIFGWNDSSMLKIYNDLSTEEILGGFFKDFNGSQKE